MRISHIEISNFRKLLAVRVDFATDKTVFVGANNSGKTSAMTALRRFLVDTRGFSINDFTLVNWQPINDEGTKWEAALQAQIEIPSPALGQYLPHLDIWLEVGKGEMHYVQKLLPTLDWKSGPLGVRLQYEPDDPIAFQQDFLTARAKNAETLKAAAAGGGAVPAVALWPQTLVDFLERRMAPSFKVKAYLLDPAKLTDPDEGVAKPQSLPQGQEPLDGNPLNNLIRIDEISAQRGFGSSASPRAARDDNQGEPRGGRRLSTQLRAYYDNHLDWQDTPELIDLKAIDALD